MIVLVDEKWFYWLVMRSFNKMVPYFALTPTYHNQHTKNSAEKVLCVASVAFIPKENDPREGVKRFLLDFTRAGELRVAQCDAYRRVYYDDGTYTMPWNKNDWLRVRGVVYFVGMEITTSLKGKNGKMKFPMLVFFRDTLDGGWLRRLSQVVRVEFSLSTD